MNRLFLLILCLVCLASYFNSLNNNFVFDDKALIIYNPLVKSPRLLPLIFKKDIYDYFWVGKVNSFDIMYRPMQLLTYFVDYKIWGLRPVGFHFVNILLHLFNSILIYYLLLRLFDNKKVSSIASILFLVHPIHTSVVSYIAGRADLLACFFMLLSILLFLRFIKVGIKGYLGLSLLFAAMALLSRESAMILFIFIALVLFSQKAKLKDYAPIVYFILLDLCYLVLRFLVFGKAGVLTHPILLSFPLRLVNLFNIIPRYISLLFMPSELHLLRVTPFIKSLSDTKTFFALVSILLYILLIIKLRKNKLFIFSMLWFLIGIVPVFSYLDGYPKLFGAMMAESWVYIPSIGFFVIFAYILSSIKKLGSVIVISFIAFYGLLTTVNNVYWKNDFLLHKRILQFNPGKNPIRRDLIDDYLYYGLYDDAKAEIEKFASLDPRSPDLDILWGNYYFFTNKLDLAIEKYNRALNRNKHFFVLYRLSSCYKRLGQLDRAIYFGLESLKISPDFELNLIQLGDIYAQKQQLNLAKAYYQMAYELNPHNKALRDLIKNAE
ncbi:MAG: tetratricopeptide repeat protein [Candidatus Omnitrophica bacterium]|nr:tetratricopeptide repeat protein [Candidatus Omnitrophota bacterium]